MKLTTEIENTIWKEFPGYKGVTQYIKKWHEKGYNGEENFAILCKSSNNNDIDLNETLHNIDDETLVKIAVDLGINTPDFIPAISVIENTFKNSYSTTYDSFQKALKQVEEDPDLAIGSANSTLESLVKHILESDASFAPFNKKDTLFELTNNILKEFGMFPNKTLPSEIINIGSGLLKVSQNIEKLRSEKTTVHGKTKDDYIIKDPLYAYFIVNAVSTVGLFLTSYYEKKYDNKSIGNKDSVGLQYWEGAPEIPF